jgi:hypothetical protein
MFIVGDGTLAQHRNGLIQQVTTLDKDLLQDRWVGAVRGETGDEFVLVHWMLV